MKRIEIKENNLNMVYEITDENEIKLLHFQTYRLMKMILIPVKEQLLSDR